MAPAVWEYCAISKLPVITTQSQAAAKVLIFNAAEPKRLGPITLSGEGVE